MTMRDIGLDDDDMTTEEAKVAARTIGERIGKNAASWVFDGNTDTKTYEMVHKGIEDGDPAIYDMYREPDLSGEMADDYSIHDLFDEIGIDYHNSHTDDIDEIGDEYVDAARTAFWDEIDRICHIYIN